MDIQTHGCLLNIFKYAVNTFKYAAINRFKCGLLIDLLGYISLELVDLPQLDFRLIWYRHYLR